MPYSVEQKVVYGDDNNQPELYARTAFCEWLKGKLNDADGPYYSKLNLSPQRLAVVTDNRKVARSSYSDETSPPVVIVWAAYAGEWMRSGKVIDDVRHEGKRYDIELSMNMGVNDATPDSVDVVAEERDEALLGAVVRDVVRDNFIELGNELGLNNPNLEQDEGKGVMPHTLTCFVKTLDTWTPNP